MSAVWVVVLILTCALVAGLCWGPRLVDLWGRAGTADRQDQDTEA